jgi:6-phosphogluconolactonase
MEEPVSTPAPVPGRIIAPDEAAVAEAVAEHFARVVGEAVERRGTARVALTGGDTPRRAYARLAEEPFRSVVPWGRVHFFWGDDRAVPPGHPRSNFGMAHRALLAHVPVPAGNLHRMRGEWAPERAAGAYAEELRRAFGDEAPRWDLLHLGLGDDTHIASLFPFSGVLRERERWVGTSLFTEKGEWRVTLTVPALRAAREIHWIVAGSGKAAAVRSVLQGALDPSRVPGQIVRAVPGRTLWILDRAAAADLDAPTNP